MKIDLSKYALDRYREKEQKVTSPGPVVTISRLYGCPSKIISQMLTDKINDHYRSRGQKTEWNFINKELLEEAASELRIHPSQIRYVFNYEEKTFFDEILAAQSSKYYVSDKRIRKTIGEVIKSIAIDGNVIIVGRAGAALTRQIRRSLHIKLIASLNWRVNHISTTHGVSSDKARKMAIETDHKRQKFIDFYYGKKSDDTLFDVLLNCEYFSKDEIVSVIFRMMEQRNLL